MAVALEASQLHSIRELSEQSHADFSSLIPLQWHWSPGIGYWILNLSHPRSNSFSISLSHSLTSWAVFHVDPNGTQCSTIHDPSPCAPLKSHPHGHCIGTWSRDCRLTAGFHAALPRHHKISTVRLSRSPSQLLKQLVCSVLILRCIHPFLFAVSHTKELLWQLWRQRATK